MARTTKFVLALALIFLAVATAPAAMCVSYLAQNSPAHGCCPEKTIPAATTPTCCIHSPAITSHNIVVPVPIVASAFIPADPAVLMTGADSTVVSDLNSSPPACSSILGI